MADQRLWAPWRLQYIQAAKPDECIFCSKPAAAADEETHIVRRGERCFAMLNTFPYNNGHLMIAPYRHVPSIEELDEPELLELMSLAQGSLAALRGAYRPEGFNMGINQGKVAGAGVEDHIHLHVVPRWAADTNYMPVVAATRVLPQALDDSWSTLVKAWQTIDPAGE